MFSVLATPVATIQHSVSFMPHSGGKDAVNAWRVGHTRTDTPSLNGISKYASINSLPRARQVSISLAAALSC